MSAKYRQEDKFASASRRRSSPEKPDISALCWIASLRSQMLISCFLNSFRPSLSYLSPMNACSANCKSAKLLMLKNRSRKAAIGWGRGGKSTTAQAN